MATATKKTKTKDVYALAQERFDKDLPRLLKKHYRNWVGYCGNRRIGVYETMDEVFREAERLGLDKSKCLVQYIEEPPDDMDISMIEGK